MIYSWHPAAGLWPMLNPTDHSALVDSIKVSGLRNPITMFEGMILDGRNRYQACIDADIKPRFIEHDGSDPWLFVFDQNGERRLDVTNAMKYGIWKKTVALSGAWLAEQEKIQADANQKRADAANERDREEDGTLAASSCTTSTTTGSEDKAKTRAAAAKSAKVDKGTVARMDALEKAAPDLYEKVTSGDLTLTQAQREAKERKRELEREANRQQVAQAVKPAELAGVYSTIVIDPPWDWGDEGDGDQLGRARPDYATMPIDELCGLPVSKLAADNSHIYMWITNRSLPKGFRLFDAWGFRYITAITWVKPSFGMGTYFRGQTEHVLFGVKGSLPLKRKNQGTVFEAPRGPNGHSSKPTEFYELVESCSNGPYLEMFSRHDRDDWTAWGQNAE